MKKKLKSGYTTGACAAAASKAAAMLLFSGEAGKRGSVKEVEIPFPDGSRHAFRIQDSGYTIQGEERYASASVIKDAGDDPDVTNGAEIVAEARIQNTDHRTQITDRNRPLIIKGGKGVGVVTKPGLSVPIGEAAINPVPRKMIEAAVMEAGIQSPTPNSQPLIEITISVPHGEELAKKTLNHRLGIVGGISILGTTGIVKPVSTEAWTATISSSMDVAKAMGHKEIVISAGRSSEKAHMKKFAMPEEVYVLMGDYLEYSLQEAMKHGFERIRLCAQWAKMVKIAMATPQTHVRFGAIDTEKAVDFLNASGMSVPRNREYNTAREIFDYIDLKSYSTVCKAAMHYAEGITGGIPVTVHLVSYEGEVIATSE